MNYDIIYKNFMAYCKRTSPKERLQSRNSSDLRLNNEHLYVERHHIIPRSVGGSDLEDNLVLLLPEEHLVAHKIRYKAYNMQQDMLAIRFILNGLKTRGHIDNYTRFRLTKYIRHQYAWIRSNSAEFRLKHGWQTADGVDRISSARKGTMPVKDAHTGEMVGSVSVDHPKVKSKEWVHHSTGRTLTTEHKQKLKTQQGSYNNNYKKFATCDFLLEFANNNKDHVVVDLFYFSRKKFNKALKEFVKNSYNSKIHADSILKNRFGSTEKFIEEYNKKYNEKLIFEPYYRSKDYRLHLSNINRKENKC